MNKKIAFVCFGEINTPIDRLNMKHDEGLAVIKNLGYEVFDGGLVIDDPEYKTADAAIAKIIDKDFAALVVCVAGWVPTHAVVRVTDNFRHIPMLLWGLCGWKENGRIITTAEQAGTTAIRPAFEALGYTFKYVYNVIGKDYPLAKLNSFLTAACAKKELRSARVGTMGYRDMLLYGTQFEGNSMRGKIGVEVEPFEMLEMVQNLEKLDAVEVKAGVDFVKANWKFNKECDDSVIESGVKYLSGQIVPYLEYYEFFEESMLIGVPDFVPKAVTEGDVTVLPAAFGLLNSSLLNVSKVKTGYVTCARLYYLNGKYKMHVYTAEAKTPPAWNEYGWDDPAPQLPSLEVFPDSCTVEEFAENVAGQHVLVAYGNFTEEIKDFCKMMDIELVM